MAYFLESHGYSVSKAYNGKEAIRAIKENSPDAIFSDIMLPDTDGLKLLKRIRELNNSLPVIIMSAFVKESLLEEGPHFHGKTAIYYKTESLPRALELLESALKSRKGLSPPS